jgi:hypothetical protein
MFSGAMGNSKIVIDITMMMMMIIIIIIIIIIIMVTVMKCFLNIYLYII